MMPIKMSKIFLGGVGLEASRVAFEINDTLTENQDISILEKVNEIYKALSIEILNVKGIDTITINNILCDRLILNASYIIR